MVYAMLTDHHIVREVPIYVDLHVRFCTVCVFLSLQLCLLACLSTASATVVVD